MATKLKDRVKVGLDETRMIVLVVQVLLGFECRAAFEPAFERLPAAAQAIKMISFGLLVVTLALLLGIPAFHRVAENGESTPRVETYLRRMMTYALWPFALGLDLGPATLSVLSFKAGMAVAAAVTTLAIFAWYIIGRLRLFSHTAQPQKNMDEKPEPTPLEEKIKQVLTECRIVLPGTQAFLGFQLIATLTDAFSKLPRPAQFCHLGSLGLVALSDILLMTPPGLSSRRRAGSHDGAFPEFGELSGRLRPAPVRPRNLPRPLRGPQQSHPRARTFPFPGRRRVPHLHRLLVRFAFL